MPGGFDVVIIGSGVGGGCVAHVLAPTGARIVILERGARLPRDERNWDPEAVYADAAYRSDEHWVDGSGRSFRPGQFYYVGGHTKVFGATMFRFRSEDFTGHSSTREGSLRPGPSTTRRWNPTTPAPNASSACTARRAPTRRNRRAPAPIRIRRSATTRKSPRSPSACANRACTPSRCRPRCRTTRAAPACAATPATASPAGSAPRATPRPGSSTRCCSTRTWCCGAEAQVVRLRADASGRRVAAAEMADGTEVQGDLFVLAAGAVNSAAILLRSEHAKHPKRPRQRVRHGRAPLHESQLHGS